MKRQKGFKPGQSGNPAGRKPGSKNKVQAEVRERIKQFIEENFDQVQTDFTTMKPEDRVNFYEKMLRYIIPPLSASSVNVNNEQNIFGNVDPEKLKQAISALRDSVQPE